MKSLLRLLMLALIRLLGALGAWLTARAQRTQQQHLDTPRILLVRPDHLGDLVLTTPVLQALRNTLPQAHITMMVGPWSSEIVARHPALDRVITCSFPGFRRTAQNALAPYLLLFRTAQQLQRGKYDLAINLRPDFWWGAALLYLTRIPRRIGYALAPATPFLTDAVAFTAVEHASVSNLKLVSAGLQSLGQPPLSTPYTPERYPSRFTPKATEEQWVMQRLQQANIDAQTPILLIHPGSGAAVKLWRTAAWSECANQLAALTSPTSLRMILTGSKSEQSLLEAVAKAMSTPPLQITDATVGQLAALLKRANLVLGVDSGPLHLAVAQQTPTVQIFGPTDPHIFGPWGNLQQHCVITSAQRCPSCPMIPCGRLDFQQDELASHPCVRSVATPVVIEAARTLLSQTTDSKHI